MQAAAQPRAIVARGRWTGLNVKPHAAHSLSFIAPLAKPSIAPSDLDAQGLGPLSVVCSPSGEVEPRSGVGEELALREF